MYGREGRSKYEQKTKVIVWEREMEREERKRLVAEDDSMLASANVCKLEDKLGPVQV